MIFWLQRRAWATCVLLNLLQISRIFRKWRIYLQKEDGFNSRNNSENRKKISIKLEAIKANPSRIV